MNPYIDGRSRLAEDLVNSYDGTLANPEWLRTSEDLAAFLERHGIAVADPLTDADLRQIRLLRDKLRAVFAASGSAEAAQHLNALLLTAEGRPQLVAGEQQSWRLDYQATPGSTLLQRITLDCALGLGLALEQYGKERLRLCAAEPCRDVFIDTSRNGTRRYCGDRCANRLNIAAHRARLRRLGD